MSTNENPIVQQLYTNALSFLREESALLEIMIQQLTSVKTAIIGRDSEQLIQMANRLQELQRQRDELVASQRKLRCDIAAHTGLPEAAATVRQLALHLDDPSRRLLDSERDRLLKLSTHAAQLNRGNLSLAAHFTQFAQHMIETLTGKPAALCYGKTGQMDTQHAPPTFQTDY